MSKFAYCRTPYVQYITVNQPAFQRLYALVLKLCTRETKPWIEPGNLIALKYASKDDPGKIVYVSLDKHTSMPKRISVYDDFLMTQHHYAARS